MVPMSGHLPRGWHALLMSPRSERDLLVQVVKEVVGGVAQVEWLEPGDTGSAHARLHGTGGRVSHEGLGLDVPDAITMANQALSLLTSRRCMKQGSTSLGAASLFSRARTRTRYSMRWRLARAAVEYSAGGGYVEQESGLLGTRPVLVLQTTDGEWRIGKRSGTVAL